MTSAALWGLALCLWLGGAVGGESPPAFYPIGIYGVRDTNDLPVLRAAGFTVVRGPARVSFLDAARAAGLRVLASPGTQAGPKFDAAQARQAVTSADRHPALWGWYLADEPDLARVDPALIARGHRWFKRQGAAKPTALALFQGYETLDYGRLTDWVLVDRYPIPWLPLANFGQHLRMARLGVGKDRPLFAIVQAFDWSYYPDLMPDKVSMRPPTIQELRCMTYLALAERANGLFYYAYDDGRWRMTDHPVTWAAVRSVVREVNERLPLFQARHVWWPQHTRYADRLRRFNAALLGSITTTRLAVRNGTPTVPAGQYVLAVNNTEHAQTWGFHPLAGDGEELPVLGESRTLRTEGGWVTDTFEPYAVRVYGPLNRSQPR